MSRAPPSLNEPKYQKKKKTIHSHTAHRIGLLCNRRANANILIKIMM